MVKTINLIPIEMAVPPKAVKISKILTKISTAGIILFILSLIGIAASFYYFNNKYQTVTSDYVRLKNNVLALEDSEQKLVLAKDRLAKISEIKKLNVLGPEVEKTKHVLDALLQNAESSVSDISIEPQKVELTFVSKTPSSLGDVLRSLTTLGLYRNIVITSITYSATSGYSSSMILNNE